MVKKLKKMADAKKASPATLLDSHLAATVKDSAQQIWLAGMGAFSKAQAEGGKVFETLVSEGMKLQRKTQSVAEDRISEVAGRMTAVADGVSSKAGAQWDKLETIFEDRVAKALHKLGVPSRADIDTLIARIDALNAQLGIAPVGKASTRTAAKRSKPMKAATTTRKVATKVAKTVKKPAARRARG
jgi:poly(hydroxyalkanoate) granule-associated protein